MSDARDVVIVGGGIHGAGLAQAAAAAGHSVLLLERTALAAGTSSRSSKLIHGGLRYLEQGRLGMVRECLRERALLLRLAPGLVRLRPFHLPVYRTTRRRPWQIRAGLSLYALLGGLVRDARFATLPREEWAGLDGLVTDGLEAVYRYFDAQTDDAALTAAVARSAAALGAEIAVPAALAAGRVTSGGVEVTYRRDGGEHRCTAGVLVNAAGPWAPGVQRRIEGAPPPPPVELVQGAHLVLRGRLEHGIYYVESARDGRAVFVMPWGDDTLVGTTETPFRGDPDAAAPTPDEVAYLAEVVDRHFPRYGATLDGAIVDAFAGVRVLPAGSGRAFGRSRETLVQADDPRRPRVLALFGGKLTSYRATAEKTLRRLKGTLPRRARRAETRELRLEAGADAARDAAPETDRH